MTRLFVGRINGESGVIRVTEWQRRELVLMAKLCTKCGGQYRVKL